MKNLAKFFSKGVVAIVVATAVHLSSPVAFADLLVKLTAPAGKTQLEPCSPVRVAADVTLTGDSQLKDVYFYAGTKALGRIRSAPWELIWENANWGLYPVYAKARDTAGNFFYSDTAYVSIGDPGQGSIIFNGGFDCSLAPWNPEVFENGVFSAELLTDKWFNDSSYAAVLIENAGNAPWSCQLTQPVKIDSGHTYQVSFWADAPEEKIIHFLFQNSSSPYNEFFNQEVVISDYAEYGPYEFVCGESSETVKFKFTFGNDTREFYLDEVRVVDLDAPALAVGDRVPTARPKSLYLLQNYPNPFNMETTIRYELPSAAMVSFEIFNLHGQHVRTIEAGPQSAGLHSLTWNGTDLKGQEAPTGIYLYHMTARTAYETIVLSKKMIVLK